MDERRALIQKLTAALLTAAIDIAEELAADHVDELPQMADETDDALRKTLTDNLAMDLMEQTITALSWAVGDSASFESLREKHPRTPFTL